MAPQIILRPSSELPDPPIPPETLVAIVARRARVTQSHASVVIELAGIGRREVR